MVVPVQGSGPVGIGKEDPNLPYDPVNNPLVPLTTGGNTTGSNFGGRIIRILPDGIVNTFAEGFDTSGHSSGAVVHQLQLHHHVLGGWHDLVGRG